MKHSNVNIEETNIANRFLKSFSKEEGILCSCDEAIEWIDIRRETVKVDIKPKLLSEMKEWSYHNSSGKICHKTGRFFSIDGIQINTNIGDKSQWKQPIINQAEIGYLGCIVKEFEGILYFLVQAKIEPGNVNQVQISPTLQATRSNYSQVHNGRAPKYLEYFNTPGKSKVLLDQLQSEQGSRFLKKRNRNIIVETSENIELTDDFRWLTLGQIKKLIDFDNIINMDLRTVISGIQINQCSVSSDTLSLVSNFNSHAQAMFESAISTNAYSTNISIFSWLSELKAKSELSLKQIKIDQLDDWILTDEKLTHKDNSFFDILWVSVEIENREVSRWDQPILEPLYQGLNAFIIKKLMVFFIFLYRQKWSVEILILLRLLLQFHVLGKTTICILKKSHF